jgi:ubiquitin carboxyl-terminal hydrolase 15
LNLVQTKPYIEQPDSDDRPDQVLADIWWENHLKRDVSAIQSIFTGQFKSITTCKQCEYNSARYEPFNMLSVPLPEESLRSFIVYIFTLSSQFHCCSVRVPKVGTLKDIIAIFQSYGLEGLSEDALFIPVLMLNYKIMSTLSLLKPIDTIRESDFLVFYQVSYRRYLFSPPVHCR